jgi:hypothetical protein
LAAPLELVDHALLEGVDNSVDQLRVSLEVHLVVQLRVPRGVVEHICVTARRKRRLRI